MMAGGGTGGPPRFTTPSEAIFKTVRVPPYRFELGLRGDRGLDTFLKGGYLKICHVWRLPLGATGITLGSTGIPLGSTGILLGSTGILLRSIGIPLGSIGIPLGFIGIPLGSIGVPLGSIGIPRGRAWGHPTTLHTAVGALYPGSLRGLSRCVFPMIFGTLCCMPMRTRSNTLGCARFLPSRFLHSRHAGRRRRHVAGATSKKVGRVE